MLFVQCSCHPDVVCAEAACTQRSVWRAFCSIWGRGSLHASVWTVPIKSRFFCERAEKTYFTVAEKQARKVMKSRWRFSWILATLAAATFNASAETDGADLESRYGS